MQTTKGATRTVLQTSLYEIGTEDGEMFASRTDTAGRRNDLKVCRRLTLNHFVSENGRKLLKVLRRQSAKDFDDI